MSFSTHFLTECKGNLVIQMPMNIFYKQSALQCVPACIARFIIEISNGRRVTCETVHGAKMQFIYAYKQR